MRNAALVALLALLFCVVPAYGQQTGAAAVFVERGDPPALVFVPLDGRVETRVDLDGRQFTVLGDSVMYFDARNRSVKLIGPDGRTSPHPFITLSGDETRVEWVVSADGKRIAWTVIAGQAPGSISTITRVADIDGAGARTVFQESRDDGVRVQPVAFSPDDARLYMDYHPDGLDALTVFPQYAGLFSLDLTADAPQATFAFLPGEPGDFTGAGFGGGYMLRLAVGGQRGGFDLNVTQLASGQFWHIPSTGGAYSVAGDVLVSPDARFAVYALTSLQGIGSGTAQAETVIMRVDLTEMTQSTLTGPQDGVLRPVAWSEEDAAVILVNTARPGTWKARMSDGRVQQVAELTFVGQLSAAP